MARRSAFALLTLTVASVQFSIAAGQTFFGLTLIAWAATLAVEHRMPSAPRWVVPLLCYAAWTLVSAAFSPDLARSLLECKQLVLLLLVPVTYEIVDDRSALTLTTFLLAAGAVSAVVGIGQYSVLRVDALDQRVTSTHGIYMTFAGLMMLLLIVALARVLFMSYSRLWPLLVLPALIVVMPLTLARNAWVGTCCAVALLLVMRDFRLTAAIPVIAAIFFASAPARVLARFYSIADLQDPSVRDRVAMLRAGGRILRAHPIVGVGPNMMPTAYPAFRDAGAVLQTPPHLHNVLLQIAAERGLPALGLWIWFAVSAAGDALELFRGAPRGGLLQCLSAAALAALAAMVTAGLFEHNFGDSEFQMIVLVIVTLPFAVAKMPRSAKIAERT
jgi:O-antigen ligase